MIKNIPTDIEKKIDHVFICLPFNKLTVGNLLKEIQPSDSELESFGFGLKIRIKEQDGKIDFKSRENKSGNYWSFNFNCDVDENNKVNFDSLNRFSNKKIILFLGTSTYRYQLGYIDQPLDFSFAESLEGFKLSISGDSYYPASRKPITSFRTTF